MRIFGGDKLFSMFNSPFFASLPEDEPLIQSQTLTKRITAIQKQVEGHHFDMRKHVLEYDDVINQHRYIVYGKRQKLLEDFAKNEMTQSDISLVMKKIFSEEAERMLMQHEEDGRTDFSRLSHSLSEMLDREITLSDTDFDTAKTIIVTLWEEKQTELKVLFEDRNFDQFQREIYLAAIDQLWMEHIENMSQLREDVAFE